MLLHQLFVYILIVFLSTYSPFPTAHGVLSEHDDDAFSNRYFSQTAQYSLPLLIQNISKYLDIGETKKALELLNELSADDQSHESARLAYGRAVIQSGQQSQGEAIFKTVLRINPDSINAKLLLGKLYIFQRKFDLSEPLILDVINNDPFHPKALALYSSILLKRDQNLASARMFIEKATKYGPTDASILFDLAMTRMTDGDYDLGREAFLAEEKVDPDHVDLTLRGRVYFQIGRFDWASDAFEKEVTRRTEKGVEPDATLLMNLAEAKDALGNQAEALALYRRVVEIAPHHAKAHAAIGLLLLGLGSGNYGAVNACGLRQNEALQHLETTLQLDPNIKAAEEAILFCQKEFTEARQWRKILAPKQSTSATIPPPITNLNVDKLRRPSPLQVIHAFVFRIMRVISPLTILRLMNNPLLCLLRLLPLPKSLYEAISNTMESQVSQNNIPSRAGTAAIPSPPVDRAFQEVAASKYIRDRIHVWRKREKLTPSVPRTSISSVGQMEDILRKHEPVIIEGLQQHWGITQHHSSQGQNGNHTESKARDDKQDISSEFLNNTTEFRFTSKELESRFGTYLVRASVSESGRFDGPENGTLWSLGASVDVLVRPPHTSMLLADFLKLLRSSNDYSHSGPGAVDETFYLEYLALHQYIGKEFLDLIQLPAYVTGTKLLRPLVTNLWIGGRPTTSPLHYDDYENLLCQIRGVKEILLFPPSDYPNLYYVGRPKGNLLYTYPSNFTRDKRNVDKRGLFVFGSSVNVDSPDPVRHPLYALTSPIRAKLRPGDTLYLPAFWHHEVQSLPVEEDATGGYYVIRDRSNPDMLNVAVNYWFANLTEPFENM